MSRTGAIRLLHTEFGPRLMTAHLSTQAGPA